MRLKKSLFSHIVIADNFETANAFLQTNEFNEKYEKQTIDSRTIAEFVRLSDELYKARMKIF